MGFGKELADAEEMLREVHSWSDEEVESLPEFYRRKAVEYQDLAESLGFTEEAQD